MRLPRSLPARAALASLLLAAAACTRALPSPFAAGPAITSAALWTWEGRTLQDAPEVTDPAVLDSLRAILGRARWQRPDVTAPSGRFAVRLRHDSTTVGIVHVCDDCLVGIALTREPGEPVLYADWMKLSQIVNNLLSNAIKFTPTGGAITVTIASEPRGVLVSVADTGLGIPSEALPHLFEKFRQIHARGTADERGSGLGLAIVRQLVELHDGSFDVTSEPQRGSTFVVHLPSSTIERN